MKAHAVVIVSVALATAADADTLRGTVVERATAKPVGGAIVAAGRELAATDDDGRFALELAPGTYAVTVTATWLEPSKTSVTVRGDTAVTLEVKAKATPGETIEVEGLAPTGAGETKVDAKFARSVPGGGDAAKIVQSLPAVARPAAGSTEIVVWGAAPNETRVFVDGVPVPALFHVGGYRSALGNDLIGDIHLTPAAFGVDRGGALGGVIDIGMADPAKLPAWRVQADVLDGSAEGRTTLGDVTVAAAIRQSWLDRAIALIEDPHTLAPNAPLPRWTDAQVVARAPMGDLVVSAWAIGSIDMLDRKLVSDDPATETDDNVDHRMARGQITVRRDRPDGFDSATLWSGVDRTTDDFRFGLIPANRADTTWVGGARAMQRQRMEALALTIGIDVDGEYADLSRLGSLTVPAREGDTYIFGQPPGEGIAADAWHATTIDAAGYGSVDFASGPVVATVGLRGDGWLLASSRLTPRVGTTPGIGSQQTVFTGDPRASVAVRIADELDLRGDVGSYHQARDASDTSAVFGTPALGVEHAWHGTAGAQWRLAPFALDVAGYARWLEDLVARDLAITPPLAKSLTQDGIGYVVGLQITARVIGWNGLSGWLAYNLSRSRRRDADSQAWRFFDHDQTHGLIAVAGWEHGPWTLGARVRAATGEPRTAVIGSFFDSMTGRFEPIRGQHNGDRLPAYFAADLRAERRFPVGAVHGAVYLEVQNLTNRANAEEIVYSADFMQRGYLTGLPLLAIAGVRLEP